MYSKYSVLLQTKLNILTSLSNIKEESRKTFLDEVTPIIDYMTNTFSLLDRNIIKKEKEEQKVKEDIQAQAVMDLVQSEDDSVGTLTDILAKLQNKINESKNS